MAKAGSRTRLSTPLDTASHARADTGPILLVLTSALFWGLWWVPVRLCEALGLTGVWPNLGINLGALLAFAAAAIALWNRPKARIVGPALLGSILIGIAVALYGAALSLTDVARAVLLFYLAPAWSTLIEVTVLKERWHWKRLPPLLLSFTGMIVVFRGDVTFDHGNIGDLAALASGMAWSAGAALVFSAGNRDQGSAVIGNLGLTVMISAVATSILLLPLGWQGWPSLGNDDATLAILIALVAGAIYLAPIIGITLWGAKRLLPVTISFLLAAEILSGITSSALFLDEPFGWWEVTGTIMIISGVVTHITLGRN